MSLLDTIRSWMGESDLRGYTVGETLLPAAAPAAFGAKTTPGGYSAAVPAPPQAPPRSPLGGGHSDKHGFPELPAASRSASAFATNGERISRGHLYKKAAPDLTTIGAAGTPVLSGFITDLQEYNPQMRGRAALGVYEQMRRSDADVAAALAACKLPIRSAQFQILPGAKSNDPDYAFASEIAAFVEECLFGGLETTDEVGQRHSQPFGSVIDNALLCLDFGCSGSEDLWRIDGDRIRLRRIAPRLPLTFYRFHVAEDGETLEAIEQWGYRGREFVNVRVPASKFTLFCLNREGANYYGRSILRQAYQHWWIKSALYRIDSISCERNSAGIPVITAAPNSSEEDRRTGTEWVENLATHENTGLFLPSGFTFRLCGIEGRIRDPLGSIQHHSEQITRSVLAMFLNLGSTATGSRALGNTFLDFFHLSLNATAQLICDAISETTIRRLVDFNFARPMGANAGKALPYPRLSMPRINVVNPLEIIELLKNVAHKDVDLIQPDDETENALRQMMGMPAKGAARQRESEPR